jgi:exopolysaccharide biosynthesis polyprenyl glycosylphosphotransferase
VNQSMETRKSRRRLDAGWIARRRVAGANLSAVAVEQEEIINAGISPVWEVLPVSGTAGSTPAFRALKRREALFRRSLGLTDVLASFLALELAVQLVPGKAGHLRIAALVLVPFIILISKALGLYDRDQHRLRKTTLDEAPTLLHLAVFYALGVWLLEALVLSGHLSRPQVFVLTGASFALTMICRATTRGLTLRMSDPERCLIVGNHRDAERAAHKLTSSSGVKAMIVGRVSITDEGSDGFPSLGEYRCLPDVVQQHGVQRVVIAPDGHDQEEILHCIRLVKALGVNVSVLPRLLEVVGSSSVFDDVGGTTLLGVRQYGLSKSSELLKRLMDVVGAGLALLVLTPLFLIVSVLIRLDSPGSAFFRQARIGRRGERFWIIKFRTMVRGADRMKDEMRGLNQVEGGLFKIAEDPRITRVGRFLRRTSLDELPQLINVLRGEMSLVGPRPLVLDEDALIEGWERRRLAVKPGMTGLWQIYGSSRIPKPEMVKIDYLYGANWSIWLDLKILIRTVPYVLGRRGM